MQKQTKCTKHCAEERRQAKIEELLKAERNTGRILGEELFPLVGEYFNDRLAELRGENNE